MRADLICCHWCGRARRKMSEWEQLDVTKKTYHRLCNPCATRRLRNPLNAMLPIRRVPLYFDYVAMNRTLGIPLPGTR